MNTSVIIPTTGRTEKLLKCIEQLYRVTKDFQCVIVVDDDDLTANAILGVQDKYRDLLMIHNVPRSGPIYCWNLGAKHSNGDAFVQTADDVWFHEGWLEAALEALNTIGGSGVVGLNNGSGTTRTKYTDSILVTRDYAVKEWGGVIFVPHYRHIMADVEACFHAAEDGKYIYANKSVVEHLHPYYGKAEEDATHLLKGDSGVKDRQVFETRRKNNWPVDYEPVFGERTWNETRRD